MNKTSQKIGPFTLGASGQQQTLANTTVIQLQEGCNLTVVGTIDGGTDGANPVDSPVGTFQLWISAGDEWPFVRVVEAETGTFSLANIATNLNTAVSGQANFIDTPGARAQVRYARSSGGAAARCTLYVTVS